MKKLAANKGILLAILLFIFLILIYKLFIQTDSVLVNDLESSTIGNDLLKIHSDLQKVTFDQSLFSSPSYVDLTDFSTIIPEQATGRQNPFDIIGRD